MRRSYCIVNLLLQPPSTTTVHDALSLASGSNTISMCDLPRRSSGCDGGDILWRLSGLTYPAGCCRQDAACRRAQQTLSPSDRIGLPATGQYHTAAPRALSSDRVLLWWEVGGSNGCWMDVLIAVWAVLIGIWFGPTMLIRF